MSNPPRNSSSAIHNSNGLRDPRYERSKCANGFVSSIRPIYKLFTSEGSRRDIVKGVVFVLFLGVGVSLFSPVDSALTLPYAYISSAIGYTYFVSWSISFYPQIFLNIQRKTTIGWSPDYALYNVFGFLYYSIYNIAFFFNSGIQEAYKKRHDGEDNQVRSNDVLFAVHAFVLSVVGFIQLVHYDGLAKQQISGFCLVVNGVMFAGVLMYGLGVCFWGADDDDDNDDDEESFLTLIDYTYFISSFKMTITFIKYVPQVISNYRRKSTRGWNVWNVILDFMGGFFSLMQLMLDCWDMGDWGGVAGDLIKFGLGLVSIFFDVLFLVQHYCLYQTEGGNNRSFHLEEEQAIIEKGVNERRSTIASV